MTELLPASHVRPDWAFPATVLLSGSEIRRIAPIADVIEVIEQAAREQAQGPISLAPRTGLPGGGTLLMAASSPERGGVAAKIVSIEPRNREVGLATIQGLASWFDYGTRRPLLVADATAVTALRTGALSAVATRALARPDAGVLAMIGAGGLALSQVEAVAAVRPITRVHVASRRRESAQRLADQLRESARELEVRVFPGAADAVRGADIVCLATTSTSPLVEAGDLGEVVHVNAVGSYRPDMREIGSSVFAAARVVCSDNPAGALHEAGDLIDAVSSGALDPATVLELGTVSASAAAGQVGGDEVTVFKSVGSAAADLALLGLLMERAAGEPGIRTFDFAG
jgi:ornithine cyclodeaminase/alanine dehydrogenase-like protein (mu-crystallin family)